MTRTLILMRHAKSSWSNLSLPDHDRPLNKRGRRAAATMGDWLRSQALGEPDEVLVSTSTRTLETLAGLGVVADTRRLRTLYHAEAEAMFDTLSGATGATVLMLGHNPAIANFAHRLVADAPNHARFCDYPTCATLVVRFDINGWGNLRWRSGTPIRFVVVRELLED